MYMYQIKPAMDRHIQRDREREREQKTNSFNSMDRKLCDPTSIPTCIYIYIYIYASI